MQAGRNTNWRGGYFSSEGGFWRFFFRRLGFSGNQPFRTLSFCSKISSIDQKQEKATTPISVERKISFIKTDRPTHKKPASRKIHQHFVPQ